MLNKRSFGKVVKTRCERLLERRTVAVPENFSDLEPVQSFLELLKLRGFYLE